jgi:hypothetical protein
MKVSSWVPRGRGRQKRGPESNGWEGLTFKMEERGHGPREADGA